jgi:predicted RNA-binding Zn-ribbon protein involved in translation (DUF1610 family)
LPGGGLLDQSAPGIFEDAMERCTRCNAPTRHPLDKYCPPCGVHKIRRSRSGAKEQDLDHEPDGKEILDFGYFTAEMLKS